MEEGEEGMGDGVWAGGSSTGERERHSKCRQRVLTSSEKGKGKGVCVYKTVDSSVTVREPEKESRIETWEMV